MTSKFESARKTADEIAITLAQQPEQDRVVEITWHRYVPHDRILAYLVIGWRYDCDLGEHHGCHACLMTWAGEGHPVEPEAIRNFIQNI